MMLDKFVSKHRERIVGLDIMRSIAILLVVYSHAKGFIPKKFYNLYQSLNFLNIDGVTIFFVLSGFLIGGILLKTISKTDFKKKDLLHFWIRRWFRTIPNYYFVLFLLLLFKTISGEGVGDFNWSYFLFMQNFYKPHPFFFAEAWSLAVEEWFYLLFPLFCYLLYKVSKDKSKSILIAALVFILVPLVVRIIKYEPGMDHVLFDLNYRKVVLLRLDSIMYGVIAAYIKFRHSDFWKDNRIAFMLAGIVLLVLLKLNLSNWVSAYEPLIFNFESITAFCFLPFLSSYQTTRIKSLDGLFIFISIISYSMYLLNLSLIHDMFIPYLDTYIANLHLSYKALDITNYSLFWFFTIVFSWLLYTVFEHPVTQLRDKVNIN